MEDFGFAVDNYGENLALSDEAMKMNSMVECGNLKSFDNKSYSKRRTFKRGPERAFFYITLYFEIVPPSKSLSIISTFLSSLKMIKP